MIGFDFKDILELVLVVIGFYVVFLFLKVNKEEFFLDKNKYEIERLYVLYIEIGYDKVINDVWLLVLFFDDISEEINLIDSE